MSAFSLATLLFIKKELVILKYILDVVQYFFFVGNYRHWFINRECKGLYHPVLVNYDICILGALLQIKH